MKQLIIITCLCATILSCKDKDKSEEIITEPNEQIEIVAKDNTINNLQKGCYEYVANGTKLQMEILNNSSQNVEGNLWYGHAEKDKNTGTFKGTLNGDKLIGQYTFMSEGVESVRDVAFKVEKNQIVEGFGDLDEAGTKFKDTTSIIYSAATPWKKVDCTQ